MVARTESLREILWYHSTWFAGEDIETGVIARRRGMTVRHIDTVVHTDVPETWRALARQRVNWWAGCFRHSWVNVDFGLHEPIGLVYSAVLVWGLFIGRVVSLDEAWRLIPTLVVLYTAVCLVGNWRVRNRMMILYPYYALLSSVLLPAFGLVAYIRLAHANRNLGRLQIPRGHAARTLRRVRKAQADSRNLKYAA
jgi:cellulose synthase/poly-beta-1,6-N-acetylglucosamine synthase-like glycosyltransferase